jgi:hypothetical protein
LIMKLAKILTKTNIIAGYRGMFTNVGSRLRTTYYVAINRVVSSPFNTHHVVSKDTRNIA